MQDYDPESLTVAEALQHIRHALPPPTRMETLALRDSLGRVLAVDISSAVNVPAHTNSAMDGYGVASSDLPARGIREFRMAGTAWAGSPFSGRIKSGECVRIMTGAVLPAGTDTVVMQEHIERDGDTIHIGAGHKAGQHVRKAGEDLAVGELALTAGMLIGAAQLGLLASLGIGQVSVFQLPRVAVFTTGDELRSLGESLNLGEIYDSNRYTLYGMLARLGIEPIDLGVVRDSRSDVEAAFVRAATMADVIITSGGVSVGEADFVKETLEKLGVVNFWKIAMKPGRPLAFGKINNTWFFGLPGNPVSVMTTFYQLVQPALRHLMGLSTTTGMLFKVPCASRLKKSPGRMEFQRGILQRDGAGQLVVLSTGEQGSGILSSMSAANCFIVLPLEAGPVEAGTLVDVQAFEGII
ncbi:MAG: gephyrin-like molybdotransferase Glp [Gammaproteobacteria bacterium]